MSSKAKLTKRFVEGLTWLRGDNIIWDTEVPGFGVRLWKGGKAYVVQYKFHGHSVRQTLGACSVVELDDARERARQIKGAVAAGRDPRLEERQAREAWTLRDAMDYFLGDYAQRRRLDKDYKSNSERLAKLHFLNAWWNRKLSSFTRDEIARRHASMSEQPRNANALLQLLSRLFTLGIEHGYRTDNPIKGIKKFEEGKRDRFLTEREMRTVWEYLDQHENVEAAACVMLIMTTGCRPAEALAAKWEHFNPDTGVWHKPASNTKQRRVHKVHLNTPAREILNRLETWKRSPYVFPAPEDPSKPRDNVRTFWDVARKKCAMPDVRLYDLRHTFASQIVMQGAGIVDVKHLLGHATITTTQRYMHLTDERQRAAAELLTKLLPTDRDPDQVPQKVEQRGNQSAIVTYTPVPDFGTSETE